LREQTKVTQTLRVGLIDADADIRFGRRMLIDSQEDCKVFFEEETAQGAQERAPQALLDVLVIDHRVRGLDGIQLVGKLIPLYQANKTEMPAIILTGPYFSYELLLSAIAAGATDLVTLDSDSGELLKAIRTSAAKEKALDFDSLKALMSRAKDVNFGRPDILVKLGTLEDREPDVLELFSSGLDDQDIASRLDVPLYRVRQSLNSILEKCSLATRAQLFLAVTAAGVDDA
jgi:DNA-binding NarL/FixJ family response regulator